MTPPRVRLATDTETGKPIVLLITETGLSRLTPGQAQRVARSLREAVHAAQWKSGSP